MLKDERVVSNAITGTFGKGIQNQRTRNKKRSSKFAGENRQALLMLQNLSQSR